MNTIITNIEHTADLGLRIEAATQEQVFKAMAKELAKVSFDIESVEVCASVAIQVEAPDREALLVRYLNEVLYYFAIGFLAIEFEVNLDGETRLTGLLHGEQHQPSKHKINHEIKRATYHNLLLYEDDDRWIGQVVFDM